MENSDLKFDEWNIVKKNIEKEKRKNIEIKKIYWIKIGKNIGSEIFGKGKNFARPVLIVKIFYNGLFLGIPLSSKIAKRNRLNYKFIDSNGVKQVALLSQLRIFDNKRKLELLSHINEDDFIKIKEKIKKDIID